MEDKRVKLDVGAITASARNNGNFLFFLYKEGSSRSLAIPLTPPDMHAVLTNISPAAAKDFVEQKSIYKCYAETLHRSGIELREVEVVEASGREGFNAVMRLGTGDVNATFVDAIIMAKLMGAPIYIDASLLERYAVDAQVESEEMLREQLQQAVECEEFEEALLIQKRLKKMERR